jgi:hypothetical protein
LKGLKAGFNNSSFSLFLKASVLLNPLKAVCRYDSFNLSLLATLGIVSCLLSKASFILVRLVAFLFGLVALSNTFFIASEVTGEGLKSVAGLILGAGGVGGGLGLLLLPPLLFFLSSVLGIGLGLKSVAGLIFGAGLGLKLVAGLILGWLKVGLGILLPLLGTLVEGLGVITGWNLEGF